MFFLINFNLFFYHIYQVVGYEVKNKMVLLYKNIRKEITCYNSRIIISFNGDRNNCLLD